MQPRRSMFSPNSRSFLGSASLHAKMTGIHEIEDEDDYAELLSEFSEVRYYTGVPVCVTFIAVSTFD